MNNKVLGCALLLSCGIASSHCLLSAEPLLSVDSASIVLPPVVRGSIIQHRFRLANRGNRTVFIKKIMTACGGSASLAGNRVEPGTTAEVVVEFKTRYLDADVTSELLTRVVTDDRALPELAHPFRRRLRRYRTAHEADARGQSAHPPKQYEPYHVGDP